MAAALRMWSYRLLECVPSIVDTGIGAAIPLEGGVSTLTEKVLQLKRVETLIAINRWSSKMWVDRWIDRYRRIGLLDVCA